MVYSRRGLDLIVIPQTHRRPSLRDLLESGWPPYKVPVEHAPRAARVRRAGISFRMSGYVLPVGARPSFLHSHKTSSADFMILRGGELLVLVLAGARVVLDADRPFVRRPRVIGDILVPHALDDGSIPPDDVVGRLAPSISRPGGTSGHRRRCARSPRPCRVPPSVMCRTISSMTRVLSAGVAVGVRGDPDRPGKAIAAHGSTSLSPREGQRVSLKIHPGRAWGR